MASDKPVLWSVVLQGDVDVGYEVELRFSQKIHRFQVAAPPDIGEIPSLAGQDVRGPQAIEMLARNASVEDLRTIGRVLYRFLCFDSAKQVMPPKKFYDTRSKIVHAGAILSLDREQTIFPVKEYDKIDLFSARARTSIFNYILKYDFDI